MEKKSRDQPGWTFIGRTEPVKDNLNPTFHEKIFIEYRFESKQPLQAVVLDVDDFSRLPSADHLPSPADAQFLGRAEFLLSEVVGARSQSLVRALAGEGGAGAGAGEARGRIRIAAEEVAEGARAGDTLVMTVCGQGLAAKDGPFGRSDPYLILRRPGGGGGGGGAGAGEEVARTEVRRQTLDPVWAELRVDLVAACGGDLGRPLRVECWDWDALSAHDSIGDADVTVAGLLAGRPVVLRDRKGRPRMEGRCGTLVARAARIERVPTLVDYLATGCEVGLSVAVDLTASNGDPADETSLHRLAYDPQVHATRLNEYQQAMAAVGEILAPYDSDGLIPAYGFGAIPPGAGPGARASFCFALNGDGARPEVRGVAGLLEAYAGAVRGARLHGPTNMAEVIARVCDAARERGRRAAAAGGAPLRYELLLILTDGEISDFGRTEAALAEAARLPVSVVIVGVHNAEHPPDFAAMAELDGDAAAAVRGGRDAVQFVRFDAGGAAAAEDLAARVLEEIPAQLVGYFVAAGRRPAAWDRPENAFYTLPTA